jgi:hypothetical protein
MQSIAFIMQPRQLAANTVKVEQRMTSLSFYYTACSFSGLASYSGHVNSVETF